MTFNTDLNPNESWVTPEWCRPCVRDHLGWPVVKPCTCACEYPMIHDRESDVSPVCGNCGKIIKL